MLCRQSTRYLHPLLRSSSLLLRQLQPRASYTGRRMASTLPPLPIFTAIKDHDPKRVAVIHSKSGRRFTYGELIHDVAEQKDMLLKQGEKKGMEGERVAFLVENSYDYVVTLLSILGTHSIALPLSPAFPAHELQYILDQSQATLLLSTGKFQEKVEEVLGLELESRPKYVKLEKRMGGGESGGVVLEGKGEGEGGMMLYTSGTTNRPKGVLLPQTVITAQAQSLIKAWKYLPTDHLLHVLPLHHIHGTINAIFAPLFAGSTIEFIFPFNATAVLNRFAVPFLAENNSKRTATSRAGRNDSPIKFFTTVPTVYNRLLAALPELPEETRKAAKEGIDVNNLRLAISGSAALPTPTKKKWADLTNDNILLERYGMTEVGMALSCGLDKSDRVDGSVGFPLPGVEVRLVETETHSVILPGEEIDKKTGKERDGEIQLRGPTIFKEYWRNLKATEEAHVEGEDGKGKWFKTGDVAVRRHVEGAGTGKSGDWAKGPMYFIRGRMSSDIIKSGGEKISALEVERELLSLPEIEECAVVAVQSSKWGQKVGAVVVLKEGAKSKEKGRREGRAWGALDMRREMKRKVVAYKIPQVMRVVDVIPRNAMGKINKKELVKRVFVEDCSGDEA